MSDDARELVKKGWINRGYSDMHHCQLWYHHVHALSPISTDSAIALYRGKTTPVDDDNIYKMLDDDKLHQVLEELERANKKHGPMLCPAEGLATLRCEVEELNREMVRKNKDYVSYRNEMMQVAAMGLKLYFQCSNVEEFDKLLKG